MIITSTQHLLSQIRDDCTKYKILYQIIKKTADLTSDDKFFIKMNKANAMMSIMADDMMCM